MCPPSHADRLDHALHLYCFGARSLNRARLIYELTKTHGLGWVGYRIRNAIDHKLGLMERKLPITGWDEVSIDRLDITEGEDQFGHYLFSHHDRERYKPILDSLDPGKMDWSERVEQIASGWLSYFSNQPVEVGFPPRWNDNLLQDKPGPPRVHFAKIDEFGCGDVKCIWEPSRFAFAYDLVRAYWRTGDERAAEVFWQLAEDWLEHNPPNRGINWKCGQESTFRAMAWTFALFGFAGCQASTPQRTMRALKLMRATGRRVEAHLAYALSQRNNHGISEAMGLFTIGLLFPLFPESGRWVALGRKHLESQAQSLIYDDGGFAQHSVNYHRVMLDDLLYAIRIGEINDASLSDTLKKQAQRAARWLTHLTEAQHGRAPRIGQDDGALILPLTSRPYDDYRPSTQSACALLEDKALPWANGPWDEHALWLLGPEALQRGRWVEPSGVCEDDLALRDSGVYALRAGELCAYIRAAKYRHRPSQLDQLHVDVWWKGINVALDPGTYSYNADGPWQGIPLSKTAAHNTVMPLGEEQAQQAGSRFIFLPWPNARALRFDQWRRDHSHGYEHASFAAIGPNRWHHRQVIRLGQDLLIVLDVVDEPAHAKPSTLHWHLADAPYQFDEDSGTLQLDYAPGPFSVVTASLEGELSYQLDRAVQGSCLGWYAPRYMKREPALWLTATIPPQAHQQFSIFGPGQVRIEKADQGITIHAADKTLTLTASDWPGGGNDPSDTLDRLAQQWSN